MSFFRYPGGKNKLVKKIVEALQKNSNSVSEYREVFFGGGSIGLSFLSLQSDIKRVAINDKDPGIACIWESVLHYPKELQERIGSYSPRLNDFFFFKSALLTIDRKPKKKEHVVDLAFFKIAIHQMSYSGLGTKSGSPLGGFDQTSDYKIDCRWNPDRICLSIQKNHTLLSKFKIVGGTCTSLDFLDAYPQNLSSNTLLYLDPPYWGKGSDLYQHSFKEEDHLRLCESLRGFHRRFVLTYDDCEEIRDLYSWANIETIDVVYSINTARRKKELLITNP